MVTVGEIQAPCSLATNSYNIRKFCFGFVLRDYPSKAAAELTTAQLMYFFIHLLS